MHPWCNLGNFTHRHNQHKNSISTTVLEHRQHHRHYRHLPQSRNLGKSSPSVPPDLRMPRSIYKQRNARECNCGFCNFPYMDGYMACHDNSYPHTQVLTMTAYRSQSKMGHVHFFGKCAADPRGREVQRSLRSLYTLPPTLVCPFTCIDLYGKYHPAPPEMPPSGSSPPAPPESPQH